LVLRLKITSVFTVGWKGRDMCIIKKGAVNRCGFCVVICMLALVLSVTSVSCRPGGDEGQFQWAVHDMERPRPAIVTPARQDGQPPANAVVLFDGTGLSRWVSAKDGGAAKWRVTNGYMEVVKKTGDIRTKRSFGSCRLHIEWATPAAVAGIGQQRGNSGVFLMDNYEVQVLDSYNNITYADGQAASLYGQYPPLVNASRGPGQWQSYDIIFHRPKFAKSGKVVRKGRITVLHNGVVVQDNVQILGPTKHKVRTKYVPHEDRLPIRLQDHGDPVRYRNIWLVELPE